MIRRVERSGEALYIEEAGRLAEVCRQLAEVPVLAVDTEFIREYTYDPALELVQIAAPDGRIVLVDYGRIGKEADGPLGSLMTAAGILKVFHDAHSDVEILYGATGHLPAPVWDTQLSAGLFGYDGRSSYGAMVQTLLGEKTPEGQARTDWSRRPLSPAQLKYAAADVQFLIPLYRYEFERLQELGRVEWAREECERLKNEVAQAMTTRAEDGLLGGRVRGSRGLDRRGLAILRELAMWRDREARHRNKPRSAVVKDDMLIEIARRGPRSVPDLREIRGLYAREVEACGRDIVKAIQRGREVPDAECPERESPGPILRGEETGLASLLSAVVQTLSQRHQVAPTLVATAGDLQQLVYEYLHGNPAGSHLLAGWRGELIRSELLGVLSGTHRVGWNPSVQGLVVEKRG